MTDKATKPHFEEDDHVITCAHVPEGQRKYNIDGETFNLGGKTLLPCERCLVAIREAILSDFFVRAIQASDELKQLMKNEAIYPDESDFKKKYMNGEF